MRKILIYAGLLLLAVVPAWAEENASPSTLKRNRQEIRETKIEQIQTRRQEFKERMNQIRDEKKKEILEHISRQLTLINDRVTKAMLRHLERLQALLDKIKDRVPEIDTGGAQAKIDEAKAAVGAQAAKEYIIEFNDEAGLRVGASAAKQQLRADLKAVREKIQLARQAVVNVLKTAKEL